MAVVKTQGKNGYKSAFADYKALSKMWAFVYYRQLRVFSNVEGLEDALYCSQNENYKTRLFKW